MKFQYRIEKFMINTNIVLKNIFYGSTRGSSSSNFI